MSASVLLVESNGILRTGLSCSLAASRRVQRVIEAAGADDALAKVAREPVQAAIIGTDVLEPGNTLMQRLRELSPRVRCIVIAHDDSRAATDRAIHSEAAGLLGSMSSTEELCQALDTVLAQRTYMAPSFKASLPSVQGNGLSGSSREKLTKRECSVLQRIGEGDSNNQIAEKLGVSPRTVDTHRTRLMRKLGIHKTADLVRYAVREGLVEV